MEKTLLTGATGFLGSIIYQNIVCEIDTLGRTGLPDIICDLSQDIPNLGHYNLVIHAAGKAHLLPTTNDEENMFYLVNVNGTRNLLIGLEKKLPKSFVFISSVSVYGRKFGNLIDESELLYASDPYGKSKIQAEKLIIEWCSKNKVICTILRLPLIAGVNPPGNLGAMIKGITKGYYFDIAGGKGRKSIVLAKNVADIIPTVAKIGGIYNLTDRQHPSFSELSLNIASQLGKSKPLNIPKWMAVLFAILGDFLGNRAPINTRKLNKITKDLTFSDQKAVDAFSWNPTPVLKGFKIK